MSEDINKFLIGFVLALLGAILVGVIASQVLIKTEYGIVNNEAEAFLVDAGSDTPNTTEVHTLTYYPTGWKIQDCPISSFVVKNGSDGTVLTADTDYTFNSTAGTFVFINSTESRALIGADNSTYLDYRYCADDYLNSSWGRNVLKLAPGLFTILILLAIVSLIYFYLRQYK